MVGAGRRALCPRDPAGRRCPRARARECGGWGPYTRRALRSSSAIRASGLGRRHCRRGGAARAPPGAAAPLPSSPPWPRRRRSPCAWCRPRHARAGTSPCAPADVGLRRGLRDAQRRPGRARSRACTSTTRSGRPGARARVRRRPCDSSAFATPDRFSRFEKVLVWATGCGSSSPMARSLYILLRHRDRFPSRRRAHVRGVRPRRARLLGRPDRAAVVRGAQHGRDRRTARRPRCAPDDGRVRRAVLEGRLAAALRFAGRNPLAAMPSLALRHVRHGRRVC